MRLHLIAVLVTGFATTVFGSQVITQFTFDNLDVGVNNSPLPSTGAGTATPLGMTNNFTTPPSVTTCDILVSNGSSNPNLGNKAWRIRSAGSGNGNGWHPNAPLHSQGVQFDISTVGYEKITVTYDWFATTQGVKHQQFQYTTDGTTWINLGSIVIAPATEGWTNGISFDLSSIAAVDNNPNFGIRMVSTYAPDGPNAGQYVNLAGNVINGTSGNWRFDTITVSGSVIPEPATLGLLAPLLLLATRRGR